MFTFLFLLILIVAIGLIIFFVETRNFVVSVIIVACLFLCVWFIEPILNTIFDIDYATEETIKNIFPLLKTTEYRLSENRKYLHDKFFELSKEKAVEILGAYYDWHIYCGIDLNDNRELTKKDMDSIFQFGALWIYHQYVERENWKVLIPDNCAGTKLDYWLDINQVHIRFDYCNHVPIIPFIDKNFNAYEQVDSIQNADSVEIYRYSSKDEVSKFIYERTKLVGDASWVDDLFPDEQDMIDIKKYAKNIGSDISCIHIF